MNSSDMVLVGKGYSDIIILFKIFNNWKMGDEFMPFSGWAWIKQSVMIPTRYVTPFLIKEIEYE